MMCSEMDILIAGFLSLLSGQDEIVPYKIVRPKGRIRDTLYDITPPRIRDFVPLYRQPKKSLKTNNTKTT